MKRLLYYLLGLSLICLLTSVCLIHLANYNALSRSYVFSTMTTQIQVVDLTTHEITEPTRSTIGNNTSNDQEDIAVDELDSTVASPQILVVGASSFIGYHLSALFTKQKHEVKLVEDNSVKHVFDPMIARRLKKLTNIEFIDFSDPSKPSLVLSGEFIPNVIIYIPTALFSFQEATTANKYFSISDFSKELKFFFNLVRNLDNPNKHIILASSSATSSIASAWFDSHERLLSFLRASNRGHSSIIRLGESYGMFKLSSKHQSYPDSWYINDITDVFERVSKSVKNLFFDFSCPQCSLQGFARLSASKITSLSQGKELLEKWAKELSSANSKNVVMTTYFTGVKNPMHSMGYTTDKFRFMRSWFLSARSLGLHMVIFHDRVSDGFQRRVKNFYPHVEFIKASSVGESPNDKRFKIFANYVSTHEEVQNILLTDMRDVTLGHNPFEIMRTIGDFIFVGQDLPYFFSTSSYGFVLNKVTSCYAGAEGRGEAVKLYTLFNAGVLGGSRTAMMITLDLINRYLKKSTPGVNCNMPALALVLHIYLYQQTFSGYPFNNVFGVEYAGSPGVAVMHKTGHRIYP